VTAIDPRDISLARTAIENLRERYSLSLQESISLISANDSIPLVIFTSTLSPFQSIVKYLRENKTLSSSEIGLTLGKKPHAISAAFSAAKRKLAATLPAQSSPHDIPLHAFNHGLSVLESISVYLHEHQLLSFASIGRLTGRDERTIWTAYHRALRKRRKT
jgi:DNA-directed RNA polymerase specialized sigma24 family protein